MKYMGRIFKNYEELRKWNKEKHIEEHKHLCRMFGNNPSMEISCMMSDHADVLVRLFGMTREEIEKMEINEFKNI